MAYGDHLGPIVPDVWTCLACGENIHQTSRCKPADPTPCAHPPNRILDITGFCWACGAIVDESRWASVRIPTAELLASAEERKLNERNMRITKGGTP